MSSPDTQWVKASASGGTGNCVELRRYSGAVEIRDTKERGEGLSLQCSQAGFATWLRSAKNGDFDDLV